MTSEEPYFPPGLMEYLEEREAIESLMDKSRDLELGFANVKVEFCDLDGMGWDRYRPSHGKQNLSISTPPSGVIPPLDGNTSSYPSSQRRMLPEKTAGDPSKHSPRRRKKSRTVTSRNDTALSEIEACPEDLTYIQYTGGVPLSRSGSSSTACHNGPYRFGDASTSIEHMENLETPRPLPTILEADPSYSYFDENPSSTSRSVTSIRSPTVPSVPYAPGSRRPFCL